MDYNSIRIKPYIKSHLELQREITLIELAPSPYFFVQSICLAYINMFARFDENPAMTLQDIKETKRYGHTHGQHENSIPTTNKVCGRYNNNYFYHLFSPAMPIRNKTICPPPLLWVEIINLSCVVYCKWRK